MCMASTFVITRNAFLNGGVDYLSGWDAEWGTVACMRAQDAIHFNSYQRAKAAKERAERFVPNWVCGGRIVYGIVEVVR